MVKKMLWLIRFFILVQGMTDVHAMLTRNDQETFFIPRPVAIPKTLRAFQDGVLTTLTGADLFELMRSSAKVELAVVFPQECFAEDLGITAEGMLCQQNVQVVIQRLIHYILSQFLASHGPSLRTTPRRSQPKHVIVIIPYETIFPRDSLLSCNINNVTTGVLSQNIVGDDDVSSYESDLITFYESEGDSSSDSSDGSFKTEEEEKTLLAELDEILRVTWQEKALLAGIWMVACYYVYMMSMQTLIT